MKLLYSERLASYFTQSKKNNNEKLSGIGEKYGSVILYDILYTDEYKSKNVGKKGLPPYCRQNILYIQGSPCLLKSITCGKHTVVSLEE